MLDKGWECPKCNQVWAPFVMKCSDCGRVIPDLQGCQHIYSQEGSITTGPYCLKCGMSKVTWDFETRGGSNAG